MHIDFRDQVVVATNAENGDECADPESGIEEDMDYEDIDDRFLVTSEEEESFFGRFHSWLTTCDGGFKKVRDANQHRSVVMSMLHFIDASGKQLEKLFSRPDLNSWITMFEGKGRKPGTIKTYLGSLKLFTSLLP